MAMSMTSEVPKSLLGWVVEISVFMVVLLSGFCVYMLCCKLSSTLAFWLVRCWALGVMPMTKSAEMLLPSTHG